MNLSSRKKRIAAAVAVLALCLSAAGGMMSDAKFRGGAIQDIPRRIKEAVETANQQSKLEAIEQLTAIRDQIREPMEEIAYIQASVDTLTRGFDILKSDYKGLLSFDDDDRDAVKERLDRLYRVEFELNQHGNTPDAWEAHRQKIARAVEEQNKQSADVTRQSMDYISSVEEQRQQIMADASAGVISEKQKKALLQSLDASVLTASNQVRAQELAISVTGDIAEKADRDLEQAVSAANQIGSGGTMSTEQYEDQLNENRIDRLPR